MCFLFTFYAFELLVFKDKVRLTAVLEHILCVFHCVKHWEFKESLRTRLLSIKVSFHTLT